jgi:hypothetical protein
MYKIIGADKTEYGPVSIDQVRQWIAEGRANAETLVQREGEGEWRPLGTLSEFAGTVPPSIKPPPATPDYAQSTDGLRPQIPNYLVQAILVTLCCCLPFGIVAIIYAAQVNGKIDSGDIPGAIAASNNAKLWCWVSFGIGVASALLYAIFYAVAGVGHLTFE